MNEYNQIHCFSESYVEARDAFRDDVCQSGGILETYELQEGKLKGPQEEPLSIDIGLWRTDRPRGIVLSSGLHGVEGYCGSAIQRAAIAEYIHTEPYAEYGVVLIHAINPFGMAHFRRVNEYNVDLNRNFIEENHFQGVSDGYVKLNRLLNPQRPYGLSNLLFIPVAAALIARYGLAALKQAVVGGQYEFPRGLFWGGDQLQESCQYLMEAMPRWFQSFRRFVHVDFHTGLGRSGEHALLLDYAADHPYFAELKNAFGEHVQPWQAGEGVAYAISGGFPEAVQRRFGEKARVVTCEFGTHSPMRVITALQAENQAHHYGGSVTKAKELIKEAFYPAAEPWKEKVLTSGLEVIERSRQYLETSADLPAHNGS